MTLSQGADNCTVRKPNGEDIQLPKFDLEPVRPTDKEDMVKVLEDKEYRDAVGEVRRSTKPWPIVRAMFCMG